MSAATFIFDFDGTLVDTHRHSVNIFNHMANHYKYKTIDWNDIARYKTMSPTQIIRDRRIPVLKIPSIVSKAKKHYKTLIHQLTLIDGIHDTLLELKHRGNRLGILSSNSTENIKLFCSTHHLDYFDFIETTSNLTRKDVAINKVLLKHKINKAHAFYVGDEIRDIQASRRIAIRMIAVAWGFNSAASLALHKPDFLIKHPKELLSLH